MRHLLDVLLELGRVDLLELSAEAGDLVVVGAALERGEDGEVDLVLVVVPGEEARRRGGEEARR